MKLCPVCGNEVERAALVCPFCDSPLQVEAPAVPKGRRREVTEVLLKEGSPTVREAVSRLERELVKARKKGFRVVKLIHGYGSSGEGGAIKVALADALKAMEEKGEIRRYITGEDHFKYAGKRNYLLNKYPELRETWNSDRGNPGITFIEI